MGREHLPDAGIDAIHVLLAQGDVGAVDAGIQPLRGGFFISAGSIGLACNKEVSHNFGFQRRQEVQWIQVVILHGICRPHNLAVPQSRKRPDKLVLYFLWQR